MNRMFQTFLRLIKLQPSYQYKDKEGNSSSIKVKVIPSPSVYNKIQYYK